MTVPTPLPLRWVRSTVDITGRFVIVRIPKPRRWLLWDLSLLGVPANDPLGYRVGTYDTMWEARQAADFRAASIDASPPYSNMAVATGILPP